MGDAKKYAVGDEVWVVLGYDYGNETRVSRLGVVTKVGRKWGELSGVFLTGYRFDLDTGRIDGRGFSSPGRVYRSEQEYTDEQATREAWKALSRAIHIHDARPRVTALDIAEARRLLRLDEVRP